MSDSLFPGSPLTPGERQQVMAWLDEMPVCFFVGVDTNGVVATFPIFHSSPDLPNLSSFFRRIADLVEGK